MTPHPQRCETQIKIEDGTLKIPLPFVFGYFPRNKYKDLVFYIKSGEHSNCGLFEMEDTVGNREMMEALASHSSQQSEDKMLKLLEDLKTAFYKYEMDVYDPDFSTPSSHRILMQRMENIIEELRSKGEQ